MQYFSKLLDLFVGKERFLHDCCASAFDLATELGIGHVPRHEYLTNLRALGSKLL